LRSVFRNIFGLFTLPLFFWRYRIQLWESFFDEIPFLHRPGAQAEELWLSSDRYLREGHWKVTLPQRCVHCGRWVPEGELSEERRVDDFSTPVLTVFLGLLVGALVGRYVALKWLPISIAIGFVVGYLLRNSTDVAIRFRRCQAHVIEKRFPRMRLNGDYLIIRVGSKEVRKDFQGQEHHETAEF